MYIYMNHIPYIICHILHFNHCRLTLISPPKTNPNGVCNHQFRTRTRIRNKKTPKAITKKTNGENKMLSVVGLPYFQVSAI
ncbi:hypothetical protein JHK86_005458 [Glycine max]|nr:hypothetical protein JHK86_005458 [Glycine max]